MSNKSGFKKYLSNTLWLFTEKILRIGVSLIVMVWLARYLGPEKFGMYSYVTSFVALFAILSSLGLEKLVPRDLLTHPEESNYIMGTSFVLRFVSAIILLPLVAFSISIVRPGNDLIYMMTLIIASTFIFRSLSVIRSHFEAHVQAKYTASVETILILLIGLLKVVLIFLKAPLIAFAWVVLIESFLAAAGLIYIYLKKSNKISSWKTSFEKAKYLLKEAYPLILAGAVFVFFTKIDQVMIGSMAGDEAVGIYAAAVKVSEGWMFIPAMLATSLFPAMLNAKKNNYSLYLQRTQDLLNIMALLGVVVGIAITFIATPFMDLIFGESYSESSLVLVIHIWGMVFYAISIISFQYFLAEGLQIYSFYRALAGLILNVVLNYFLIPLYGVIGAAVATVVSQVVAVWILNLISPKTRVIFFMQTKALSLYGSINTLQRIKSLRAEK